MRTVRKLCSDSLGSVCGGRGAGPSTLAQCTPQWVCPWRGTASADVSGGGDTLWCGSLGGFGFVLAVRPLPSPWSELFLPSEFPFATDAENLTVLKLPLEADLVAIPYYFLFFDSPCSGL